MVGMNPEEGHNHPCTASYLDLVGRRGLHRASDAGMPGMLAAWWKVRCHAVQQMANTWHGTAMPRTQRLSRRGEGLQQYRLGCSERCRALHVGQVQGKDCRHPVKHRTGRRQLTYTAWITPSAWSARLGMADSVQSDDRLTA